jgi:hypothetical protein
MNNSIVTDALVWEKLHDVDVLAEKLGQAEIMLEGGYAQFAGKLLEIQEERFWDLAGFESWGKYFDSIIQKFNLGKAQMYHKLAVVRELKGIVPSAELTDMGISKASVLADACRAHGGILPNEAIAAAKNPDLTVKGLKKTLATARILPEQQDGEWLDLGMAFYVTEDERAEIAEAMRIAREMDPPVSNTLKDFMQRKEVFLRFVREFLATYSLPEEIGEGPL